MGLKITRTQMTFGIKEMIAVGATIIAALGLAGALAFQASATPDNDAIVVTPGNLQGWVTEGDAIMEFVVDGTAPAGSGALRMSASAEPQYGMFWKDSTGTQTNAADLNVSYMTKRVSGPAHAAPSYVLLVDKDGNATTQDGFYAIYEPAYNDTGSEDYNIWNKWDITAESNFWYATAYEPKPDGAVNYTSLNSALANHPNATISAVVLNIGTGNAGWSMLVDSVVTPENEYDFEPTMSPDSKDSCKDGKWTTFNNPTFKNQGQCVSSVANKK